MGEFCMPSLGADMTEATLLEWLVAPGDVVHRGDVVAVVDTSKAAMEIETFEDGVVQELLVPPGTVVPVGGPMARLGGAAREPAPVAEPVVEREPVPVPEPAKHEPLPVPAVSPPLRKLARRLGVDVAAISGTGPQGKISRTDIEAAAAPVAVAAPAPPPARSAAPRVVRQKVSPRARRLAAERGVDVATLAGSGHAGAVTGADVLAVRSLPARQDEPAAPTQDQARARSAAMRATIGALMARSKREVPHYYLSTTIDMSSAMAHVTRLNADRPVSGRLVPAAVLLKAAAVAVHTVPQLNGWWTEGSFVAAEHVHLGVAVSLRSGGLIAPAIHDADTLTLDELMAALRDVVTRARGGRLRGSEMSDGTITVTNLGDRGVEAVFGVIYPPQVALVGFGRIVDRPWASGGMLGVRPVVTATLSADHRATDGHIGATYLSRIEDLLSRPEEL